jgi:hypothetical protein
MKFITIYILSFIYVYAVFIPTSFKLVHSIENTSSMTQVTKISLITKESLKYGTKAENVQRLLELAVKEKKISFTDRFKYGEKFVNLKNGDEILLKSLKNNENLDTVLYSQS